MSAIDKIIERSDWYEEDMIALRRQIHQNPETAFEEYETSALVCRELEKMGIPYEKSPVETGVIATIDSGRPGRLLMLRADMDALPIREETGAPFASRKENKMHACGHDVHTANLLTVGRILNEIKEEWKGRVRLVFQPGEEHGGGGRRMIENGLMDELPDGCIGLHVIPMEKGQFIIGSGYLTAYSDGCEIIVRGKEAHSSAPQSGVDAITIAAATVMALNTIVSRSISPMEKSTFNVGMISGGSASNIIPGRVSMQCMMRNITPEAREIMHERIEKLAKGTAETMGGECEVKFRTGYPSVYNNPELTDFVVKGIEENAGELYRGIGEIPKEFMLKGDRASLIAEDFGFYAQKTPSCFIQVGTGAYAPAHSPQFFVDESWIKLCTRAMALSAVRFLGK